MAKVVPTDGSKDGESAKGGKDSHLRKPPEGQPVDCCDTDGATDQEANNGVSLGGVVGTTDIAAVSPAKPADSEEKVPADTIKVAKPPSGEDEELKRQDSPAVLIMAEGGGGGGLETARKSSHLAPPILDMDKQSGVTTVSLVEQVGESSLDRSGQGPIASGGQEEEDEEENEGTVDGQEKGEEGGQEKLKPERRGTQRFARQNTGIGLKAGVLTGDRKKKETPFHVPRTMYMGHPVGSSAAELLERQQHRLGEVKIRQKEVSRLLELVMKHNALSSGSALPDIDEVFPDKRCRENSEGDRYI